MEKRTKLANFWDGAVQRWIDGSDLMDNEILARWFSSYRGEGRGAVNLSHFPDPYVGNLRGLIGGRWKEPRVVTLGLNPGIGVDALQSRTGLWTSRIAQSGLSHCFDRHPEGDPMSWLQHQRRPSMFWRARIAFAKRWLADPSASVEDIICFEMYPWHSVALTAGIHAPREIIAEFVLDPIAEFDVKHVFAFGSAWFKVAEHLRLTVKRMPEAETGKAAWKVGIFQLPSGQDLVVSSQLGYAGPPGENRVGSFRRMIAS